MYKIELMKLRSTNYLWAFLGIFVSLLAMGIFFLFLGIHTPEQEPLFRSWNGLFALSTALTVACFGIFSAVVAGKIIVEEYCGKNALLLFTYPVSRITILNIKCRIVLTLTTAAAFVCNMFVMGAMYLTAQIFRITPDLGVGTFFVSVLLSSCFGGILSSAIGVIAAVVGWKKRSAVTSIVCSLLIVCFVPNMIASLPDDIVWVMLIMSAVFLLIAKSMYHVLAKGIEEMEV